MKTRLYLRSFLFLWLFSLLGGIPALALPPRVSNTTLQMPPTPATFGYVLTNAFGSLVFVNPTTLCVPPGETNRLFVLEQAGRILVITNLASPNLTTFLNLSGRIVGTGENGFLGLAFHPGYRTNRYFYLFYSQNTTTTNHPANTNWLTGLHQRVSRFEISATDTNLASATSETPILTLRDDAGNHNGGDLHFGPDGYLYISLGDEGNGNDTLLNSQRLDKDLWSGILRIDVDKRPGNLPPNPHPSQHPTNNPTGTVNYLVPADNPFLGWTNFNNTALDPNALRTEFWAVGLRNPWRFSFDVDGTLYCADVGQSSREEVNVIVKGGNYGWYYREGKIQRPGSGSPPPGFTALDPILDYGRGSGTNQGSSVTGGLVYRGSRFAQLFGAYLFADYGSGNLWALRHSGTNVTSWLRLAGSSSIAGFGTDPRNGDLLTANQNLDTIQRLVYNNAQTGIALPATLADTGVFTNLATLTPHAGVVPYDVNSPLWSDNATKTRWFSVPNTNLTITFHPEGNWSFPTGTVWIKHFDLALTNGFPASAIRLETRLLVKTTDGVYGATYRWDSATNATLVPEAGMDETFTINDGGNLRTQVWHYPSRSECLSCHSAVGGYALGFNTAQLNRDFHFGETTENQISAFSQAGYFSAPVTQQHTLRSLAATEDASVSLEYRARSYLAANCAQCHQPGGAALGEWDARITNPLSLSKIINGSLLNNLGDAANRIIAPNDPAHSVLLTRLETNGSLRMPPLASNLADTNTLDLLRAWITNELASYQTFGQWQVEKFGSTNTALIGATEDYDGDGSVNFQEYLLGTDPTVLADAWRISILISGAAVQIRFPQIKNRGFTVEMATSLATPILWQPLDVPGNRPWFSLETFPATISDGITNAPTFYRVRVDEP